MNASTTRTTFLAAGQRYIKSDRHAWRVEEQITVVWVSADDGQESRVAYRCPDGRIITGDTSMVEAAIRDGRIIPVVGSGSFALCA